MQMLLQNISLLFLNLLGSCVPVSLHQHFSGFMVVFRYVDYMIYCLEAKVHQMLNQLAMHFTFPVGRSTYLGWFHNLTIKLVP